MKSTKSGVFYQYGYIDITKNRDPCVSQPKLTWSPNLTKCLDALLTWLLGDPGSFLHLTSPTLSYSPPITFALAATPAKLLSNISVRLERSSPFQLSKHSWLSSQRLVRLVALRSNSGSSRFMQSSHPLHFLSLSHLKYQYDMPCLDATNKSSLLRYGTPLGNVTVQWQQQFIVGKILVQKNYNIVVVQYVHFWVQPVHTVPDFSLK